MGEDKGVTGDEEMETKRTGKLTEIAMRNKLHRLIGARRGLLVQITGRKKEIESLMSDAGNKQKVQESVHNDFSALVITFEDLTWQVGELLFEEEKDAYLNTWVGPKMLTIRECKGGF